MILQRFFFQFIFGLIVFGSFGMLASAKTVVPNELGRIPVMEYHRFALEEGNFIRSYENFRKDLEFFYNNAYVLITVEDFIEQDFDVPAGRKPLIFTFDDSTEGQFRILDDLTIDSESAIGIMDAFFVAHPDFGRSGIFYVLQYPFGQSQYYEKKLRYLLDTDREIGNHTLDHDSLKKLDASGISRTLGGLQKRISEILGGPIALTSLAYPYGAIPSDNLNVVASGMYDGETYEIKTAFLVGADPAYPPYYVSFDAMRIPRIQADDTEFQRWFRRDPGSIDRSEEIFSPFVSDGSVETISVLEQDMEKFDMDAVKDGLFVVKSGEIEVLERAFASVENDKEEALYSGELPVGDDNREPSAFDLFSSEYIQDRIQKYFAPYFDFYTSFHDFISEIEVRELPSELIQKEDGYYYTVQSGDTLSGIVEKFLPLTFYYVRSQLSSAIQKKMETQYITVDQELKIPGVERVVFHYFLEPRNKNGIYWTGYTAGSGRALDQIENLKAVSGNMVIFDVKETAGEIFYATEVSLANEIDAVNVLLPDIEKLVYTLHRNGMYAVARQTVFKDALLARLKPEYAVKSRSTGGSWANREGVWWVDPSHPDVQDYNIAIAVEMAELGVDEIQFDYIRFPTLGNVNDAMYTFEKDHPDWEKYTVIAGFLEKARKALEPYDVKLGIDVYGIVAWNDGYDAISTGQKMEVLADYVDVVYPMVYPSHFGPGFAGHAYPADEPYFFVQESTRKFQEMIDGRAEIIPWIQGFPYMTSNFGTWYVREQIQSLEDIGIYSYAVWSASNIYMYSLPAF